MVWHVHFKDGKFNIWSTVVDAYILKEWVPEQIIIEAYKEHALEAAEEQAKSNIERAKKEGCSAMFVEKHSREEL